MSVPQSGGIVDRSDPMRGIIFKTTGVLALSVMTALVKEVGQRYPLNEVVFARSAFMLIPVLITMAFDPRGLKLLYTRRPFIHARRAFAGLLALIFTFATLTFLPLGDATALSFSAPLFLVALALPLLGEHVGRHRWGAALVGFVGVLLVAAPHIIGAERGDNAMLGVALGLLSALFIALSQLALRTLRGEPATTSVFYFTLTVSVASALSLPFSFRWPASWLDGLMLVATGVIGGAAQLCFAQGYRFADASLLAPFDYMQIVWALIIGLAVFGEAPVPIGLAGMGLIVAGGLYIALRERKLALKDVPLTVKGGPPAL